MRIPLDKPTPSEEELASKYGVSLDVIAAVIHAGIEVEREHTSDDSIAREIALDHLSEKLNYYELLKMIEGSRNARVSRLVERLLVTATSTK